MPTSILLPVLPLLRAGLIRPQGIIADSMSGVSGAGRTAKLDYIFAECNESVRAYSVPKHRHLAEIDDVAQHERLRQAFGDRASEAPINDMVAESTAIGVDPDAMIKIRFACLRTPTRRPSTSARASPAAPALMCTAVPPAKSRRPSLASQPAPVIVPSAALVPKSKTQ